jgi:hypothetical protein
MVRCRYCPEEFDPDDTDAMLTHMRRDHTSRLFQPPGDEGDLGVSCEHCGQPLTVDPSPRPAGQIVADCLTCVRTFVFRIL